MDDTFLEENKIFIENNQKKIYHLINKYFPKVPSEEKEFIINYYGLLLFYIKNSMFESEEEFWEQMESNKKQDLETIFLLLFPYLKNKNTQDVLSVNEIIYDKKIINLENYKNYDLLKLAKELKYTNKLLTLINNKKTGILEIDYRLILLVHLDLTLSTIRKINNKMMINWHNTWPMGNEEIELFSTNFLIPKKGKFLENTLTNLDKIITENDNVFYILNSSSGLWLGEIYQQIYHRFYLSVMKVKFLIYPYVEENKLIYGAEILDDILKELLNSDKVDYSKSFYDYDDKTHKSMEINFNRLKENLTGKRLEFLKMIVLYFLYSSSINNNLYKILIKNKQLFFKVIENINFFENELDYLDSYLQKDENRMILLNEILEELTLEELFNFIYNSIEKFKTTPYYRFLYKKNEDKSISLSKDFEDRVLNIKWIYNWSKSCFYGNKSESLPKFFDMNIEKTITFFEKLVPTKYDWFNINQNIKRAYGYDKFESKEIHEIMVKKIDNIPFYLILVFDDMLRNGVLSEFKVNTKLTDKTKLPRKEKQMIKAKEKIMKEIFKNNDWENSYYYLTNEKYKDLGKYSLSPTEDNKTFFEHMETLKWPYTFANDWVCQIYFNTHFLNQQIMYVTGATGTGKSTHVPKLTLYATKAFLYKYSGHVMGTQPRVGPTKNNIWWISKELGVPISNYEKVRGYREKQDIPTDNYYLQFKYQGDKHMKNDKSLKLTMVTDGTLLSDINNSITLKRKLKLSNNETKFSLENIYDVIMIDESHEHNMNMDLILSMMKQTLYYNPEIRLLIISATMDDDEPIYRSYYSLLDDNQCFPFNNKSFIDFDMILDKNLYDRRFHMAPPGQTTQFKVEEVYVPVQNLTSNPKTDSQISQEEAYKVIVDIANKNPTGDILFFSVGKAEINQAVEALNKILPDKTIALPYYTSMNAKYKNIVTKIEKYISSLKVRKDKVHIMWGEEYEEDETVPKGIYNRVVIIATNVAEASITINSLKFVVDTGYAKVAGYNEKEGSTLKIEEISEASRIQRKGRVGRVSSGIAYFMYKKGGRENNRPKLGITQQDPKNWMNSFIKNKNVNVKNKFQNIMSKENDFRNRPFKKDLKNEYIYNIQKTSQLEYLNEGMYYERNSDDFIPPKSYYKTNDDVKNKNMLLDFTGEYWIIHPKEINITRNVFYDIIKYDNIKTDEIPEEEQVKTNDFIIKDRDLAVQKMNKESFLITTPMSQMISLIEKAFEINNKEIIESIVFGASLGVLVQVIITLTLGEIYKWDIFKLLGKKSLKNAISLGRYNSDIEIFIELGKMIITSGNNPILNNLERIKKNFMNKLLREIEILKKKYYSDKTKLHLEDMILLDKIHSRGEMNNKASIKLIISKTKHFKKILRNIDLEFKIPKIFSLKDYEEEINNKFIDYLINYLTLQFYFESNTETRDSIEVYNKIKNDLSRFGNLCSNETEKVLFSLVAGRPKNTMVYSSIYKTYLDRSKNILGVRNTLIGKSGMVHYMSSQTLETGKMVNCISNVPIKWLVVLDPKYYYTDFVVEKIVNNKLVINPDLIYYEKQVNNNFSLVKQYWNTKNLKEVYDNVIRTIKKLKK